MTQSLIQYNAGNGTIVDTRPCATRYRLQPGYVFRPLHIRVGFELSLVVHQPTLVMLLLNVHYSRVPDLVMPEYIDTFPYVELNQFPDENNNKMTSVILPPGQTTFKILSFVKDSGNLDVIDQNACHTPVQCLPHNVLKFLIGSRYCETDLMSEIAWELFGSFPNGWARVQAAADWIHNNVTFDLRKADCYQSAVQTFTRRTGVCRDFAHLLITFCRAMNFPARYIHGYIGDIGIDKSPDPMDFSAWTEIFFNNRWYTFDAIHNTPRIGRVAIAKGMDAADSAIVTSYGQHTLVGWKVITDLETSLEY